MANIISKRFDSAVTPSGGKAMYAKLNSRVDEYEGKRKYTVDLVFDDKDVENRMKKFCDDTLQKAKESDEFKDKKWRTGDDLRCGYSEFKDGKLHFRFQTGAYYKDKESGEEVRKYIPIIDTKKKKKVANDVSIGNGSEMRISFFPMAYWMTKDSNGLNLYINKIAVDNLIEFGNSDDFSEFGIELDEVEDDNFAADDEVPI